jgi:hypothetical protein
MILLPSCALEKPSECQDDLKTQFIADITKAQGFPKLHWRNLCDVRKMI